MKKLFNHQVTSLFIFLFLLITNNSYAFLDIEITQGVDNAIPIVVLPFETSADHSQRSKDVAVLQKVISADLHRSGVFKSAELDNSFNILNSIDQLFSNNSKGSKKLNNLDKSTLSKLQDKNIEYAIQGNIEHNHHNRLQVSFRLLDVYNLNRALDSDSSDGINTAVLLNKSFSIDKANIRNLAHHISDLIYEQLTGIKGVFSSKIAYVNVINKTDKKNIINREYALEIADSDGFNPQPLIISSEPIMSPTWHPNGKQIAYVSFAGFRSKVNVVELATGNTKTLSRFKGINGAPSWSPDGTKLALVLSNENIPKVYILDLNTNKLTQVTTGPSIDTEPRWAPDGKSFVFTSNRGGGPQIYKYSLDSKKITRMTYEGGYNARGSFTPDGKKLVMIHRGEDSSFNIAVLDLTTYNLDVLTNSANFVMDESPSVSANGQQIIYATKDGERGILAEVSVDGRVKLKRPSRQGDVQEPAWSPYLS